MGIPTQVKEQMAADMQGHSSPPQFREVDVAAAKRRRKRITYRDMTEAYRTVRADSLVLGERIGTLRKLLVGLIVVAGISLGLLILLVIRG